MEKECKTGSSQYMILVPCWRLQQPVAGGWKDQYKSRASFLEPSVPAAQRNSYGPTPHRSPSPRPCPRPCQPTCLILCSSTPGTTRRNLVGSLPNPTQNSYSPIGKNILLTPSPSTCQPQPGLGFLSDLWDIEVDLWRQAYANVQAERRAERRQARYQIF